jgi:threonine aldolase
MHKPIDLRSDTVTKPSDAMRKAMYEAEVGDDVFGEDKTIIELQERVAEVLGKEAALYVPSGTLSNQIALKILTNAGDEVYCDKTSHIFNYEGGAASIIARIQINTINGERGIFTREDVEPLLRPKDHHFALSKVVEIENTSNRGGGAVWPLAEVRRLSELCIENDMKLHIDGARLWNAAVASGTPENVWAQYAETVSVCFSKGLGAPVGSALVGPNDLIDEAHRWRKRLGGGMRQAGIIAAGALYGLNNNRDRLVDDHKRAKRLAQGLSEIEGLGIDVERIDTNIILVDISKLGIDSDKFAETVGEQGLFMTNAGRQEVRFVTHLDVDDDDIERAIEIVRNIYGN